MSSSEDSTRIIFPHIGRDTAPTYHVSGGLGSQAPDGCIGLWLFNEIARLPDVQTGLVDGAGKLRLDAFGQNDNGTEIERRIQCLLVMQPKKAKEIGEWLVKHAEEALQAQRQGQEATVQRAKKQSSRK